MQIGTAYAIWSGAGTVLVSVIAWLFIHQKLDTPSFVGITLIIIGVMIIKFFSAQGEASQECLSGIQEAQVVLFPMQYLTTVTI